MIHALRHGARRAMLTATASVIALTFAVPAHAGGSSMPWEAPLQSILESIEGPVAKIIAVHHHHRHRPDAGVRRYVGRRPPADPDRVRPVDRLRRVELLPVVLLVRRRSAGLMGGRRADRGLLCAGPPGADRADPARRRPALARHRQRHAGGRDRARPAALDRGPGHLGDRPRALGLGGAARPAIRGRGPPPPPLPDMDAAMMSLREYRTRRRTSPTSCPGPRWSARASCSTRTAASSAPRVSRPRSRQRHAGRAGRDERAAEQCAPPARLGLGDLRRGAAHARARLSGSAFPIRSRRWSIWSGANSSARKAPISRAPII